MLEQLSTPTITTDPNIRNGKPCIAGTGLRVTDIVMAARYEQRSPSELAAELGITGDEVCVALAYYEANQAAIDADIEKQIETFDKLAKQGYGKPQNRFYLDEQMPLAIAKEPRRRDKESPWQ